MSRHDRHDRHDRLARVLAELRLPAATPILLASDSNDVWRIGSTVLRICWRGDPERFAREAAVAAALPAGVPYPPVLAAGRTDDLPWQLTGYLPGVALAGVWPGLTTAERRAAIEQLGAALATLHAHRFPAEVVAVLVAARPGPDPSASDLIGADINPLPVGRALSLVAHLRAVPGVDVGLVDAAGARLRDLAAVDPLDPLDSLDLVAAGPVGCVHGDAHIGNVLWRDGRVVALLDLEWARLGPADLELEPYLRPEVGGLPLTGPERREIFGWLAAVHPAAFAGPDLVRRLWLYELAHTLRQTLIQAGWGDGPDEDLNRLLRGLVDGPGWLVEVVPATG